MRDRQLGRENTIENVMSEQKKMKEARELAKQISGETKF